jgi:hypothetical protein
MVGEWRENLSISSARSLVSTCHLNVAGEGLGVARFGMIELQILYYYR